MSVTYRNVTFATIIVEDERGIKHTLRPGGTVTGTAYMKRFCWPELSDALLEVTADDGSVWAAETPCAPVNRRAFSTRITVAAGTEYGSVPDSIDIVERLGGPALTLDVRVASDGASVTARLNSDDNIIVTVDAGESFSLDNREFAVSRIEFANASEDASATVDIFASAR